ncbi:MAG: M48 family metalloprotease [Candidatus Hydrogenedens sp.]|jgi:predicted Zn-dependent protease|nr:M48 family metalloprotease [Candidatus Hydrogenedens sp.]
MKKFLYFVSVVVLLACLSGCETLEGFTGSGGSGGSGFFKPLNLLSTDEEISLGQQFAVQIEESEKILDNPALQNYVAEMGRRLAAAAPRQDVPYSFKVIDAPDTVNAFALPGGYMYIYTGLMKTCSNEAELAAVMAHEIGHVAAHHHGEMMTRQMGMDMVSEMILGKKPGMIASLAGQLFTTGISARYSRAQEREADSLGMDIMYKAGYPPQGMIAFMNKLLEVDRQQGGGRGLPIFATHPSPEERVGLLQELIQRYPLTPEHSAAYREEQYRLAVLSQL